MLAKGNAAAEGIQESRVTDGPPPIGDVDVIFGLAYLNAVTDPVRRRDKRNPFSETQLRRIFEALDVTTRGRDSARRARFWVPLIALFSGMRLNEICQLDVADMVEIDGVLCFNVASGLDQEDRLKRVKTAASERLIPVHPELHAIGLSGYVSERVIAGDAKLFPELRLSSVGYRSTSLSRWFSRFLVTARAVKPKTCFHSFRHNFRDALRSARVDREVALHLGGWALGTGREGMADNYGAGPTLEALNDAVSRLTYSGLDLSSLHRAG